MLATDALARRVAAVRATGMVLGLLTAGGFGAAVSLGLGRPAAGAVLGAAAAAVFVAQASTLDAARRLERLDPELSGAVTAFVEGGGGRLREDLAVWVLERRPRASYRRPAAMLGSAAAAVALAFAARSAARARPADMAREAPAGPPPSAAPYLRIAVEVEPPAYAHRPSVRVAGPTGPIEALKGSRATLLIDTSLPSVALAEEGKQPQTLSVSGGAARSSLALDRSTALRIGADLVVVFNVVPDRPPDVELTLPREDRTVTAAPGPFGVKAAARDDIGLESLALFYTLAHGHGEGMTFKSGRIDGPRAAGPSAEMSSRLDPGALGLRSGDTLVMWAEAADGNAVDGPSRTASSVRILRFEEDLSRIEMKSSAPAIRPLNGPLSQREILARTLRLIGEGLPKEKLRERSFDLAQEQGKLRSAYGQFLHAEDGNAVELDMEQKEASELGDDRAQRLLAEAVSAMWSSEGELSTGNPKGSVPHQRLALKRLDEAFGSERYALRALAPPKAPVDERRRLKGDAKGLAPRTGPDPVDRSGVTPAVSSRLASLARRLLLASESPSPAPSRVLADELWALPDLGGLSRSTLAAPLYAARTPEEAARASRAAADGLLRFLEPHPAARPPVSPEEARLFTRLDGEGPGQAPR